MRIAGFATALVVVSFAACGANDAGKVKLWKGELPVAPAFLRERLPADVVIYTRVPNLLGMLAMPKGGQLDSALRSEANIQNVKTIQQGLTQNVLALPAFSDPRLKFLADAVRSPIEVAGFGLPNPSVLVGATLATRTNADFNKLFDELGRVEPSVRLATPLDNQGIGQLVGLPLMTFVKFDASTGRLLMFAAPKLDRAGFEQAVRDLPMGLKDHPMYALEQKIDASGQGLFLWADAARIVPMVQTLAPGAAQGLGRAGFAGLRAVAFGFGTANSKGRLSLVLDVGNDRKTRFFPLVTNTVKATSVGDPDAAVLFSIPSQAEFARLESMLLATLPPNTRNGWQQVKVRAKEMIGVEVEEIFSAIGPDMVVLFDQVGDYTAVRLRDPALFDDVVRRIASKIGSVPDQQKIGGATIYHWRLPSVVGAAANAKGMLAVLGRLHNHVYWIRDGEYLYLASTPQSLIDRVQAGAKARVADWLATKQRIDTSTSLFAATGSVSKMPRRTYEAYIGIMQDLADISESKFDIWSMPTADQLALPEKGAVGFSVNLGEPYLSVELSYENHPGELLLGGGGIGAVATVGILAAIAVPAYQDYTIRAQVSEGLNLAATVRAAVAESFATRGALPKDRRAAGLSMSPTETSGIYVESVDVSRGVITITYGKAANAKLRGKTLTLTPSATTNREIIWRCGYASLPADLRPLIPESAEDSTATTIERKYLPAVCR